MPFVIQVIATKNNARAREVAATKSWGKKRAGRDFLFADDRHLLQDEVSI